MKLSKVTFLFLFGFLMVSCVSKKKFTSLQTQFDAANKQLGDCGEQLNAQMTRVTELQGELNACNERVKAKDAQMTDLRAQLAVAFCKLLKPKQTLSTWHWQLT